MNNQNTSGGITVNGTSGTSISGLGYLSGNSPAGLEVWIKNGSNAPTVATINAFNTPGGNSSGGYAALSANGFTLATSFTGVPISLGGFALGQVNMAGVSPAASTVTMAIAAWNGSGTSFNGSDKGGVLAFTIPTVDYTLTPAPTANDLTSSFGGFNNNDLILNNISAVPEPSTFALAGLGAAALLIFRRRK